VTHCHHASCEFRVIVLNRLGVGELLLAATRVLGRGAVTEYTCRKAQEKWIVAAPFSAHRAVRTRIRRSRNGTL
jgi:hypothetical protein